MISLLFSTLASWTGVLYPGPGCKGSDGSWTRKADLLWLASANTYRQKFPGKPANNGNWGEEVEMEGERMRGIQERERERRN